MADETLTIETPEHVELQFALASIGNRFLACAIDHLLQMIAVTLVTAAFYLIAGAGRGWGGRLERAVAEGNLWVAAILSLIAFAIFFGYFAFFETIWNGQTPGKRWMKLRVIQEDGRPINFFAAFSRNMLRLADMLPPPFYSLGIVSIFASERAKRLGDFLANTVVIKERTAEAPKFDDVFTSEIIDTALRRVAAPVAFRADLRALTEPEIEVVENFLRRRYDIPEHPRAWLAWRIAVPLMEKLQPAYEAAGFSYEGFLEELLVRCRAART
jgi:uncharacterized RDD family membrane protein YckC